MSRLLTVKFPWALRRRDLENDSEYLAGQKSMSRTARYIKNLKDNNIDKYEKHLKKDRARVKQRNTKVEDMSETENTEIRRKWAQRKANQRKRKREAEEAAFLKPYKKIKLMTEDEKREYERDRKRHQRKKAAKKKLKAGTSKSKVDSSMSKSTIYRKLRDIKEKMPNSPTAYANVLDSLATKTTPRKQKEIEKMGFVKRSLFPVDSEKSPKKRKRGGKVTCSSKNQEEGKPVEKEKEKPVEKEKLGEKEKENPNEKENPDGKENENPDEKEKEKTAKKKKGKDGSKASANVMSRYLLAKACKSNKLKYKDVRKLGVSAHIYSKVGRKPSPQFNRKRTGLPQETVNKIEKFWYQISRPLPIKKRVKKKAPLYLLECSYITAYRNFKKVNKEKVGYVTFIKHKPKNVRQLRPNERITCCCIKCENVKLLMNALNKVTRRMENPDIENLKDEKECSDLTLCNYETFPRKQCTERICSDCGTEKISEHFESLIKELGTEDLKYNQWKNVKEIKSVKGTEKVVMSVQLVTEVKKVSAVVEDLKEKVKDLSAHLFRAKWQQHTFAEIKEHMPPKSVVMVLDFAENYTCMMQNEAQSHHWAVGQVTIHPVVAYVNNSDSSRQFTNIESFVFITDDRKHDSAAVQTFSEIVISELNKKFQIQTYIEYTDCCAGQYRGKASFADLSFTSESVDIERNYFESSHGKSAADGLSAVVKSAATKAVLNNQTVIRNAKEFYEFCEQSLDKVGDGVSDSEVSKYKHSNRKFYYVHKTEIAVNRRKEERNVKTVKGTMKIHNVKGIKPYEILMRNLSCFCTACNSGNDTQTCENESIVGPWTEVKLCLNRSKSSTDEQESGEGVSEPEITSGTPSTGVNEDDINGVNNPMVMDDEVHCLQAAIADSKNTYTSTEQSKTKTIHEFEEKIRTKGFKIRGETPEDGNCFFWAVSDQLDRTGSNEVTHTELRGKVVQFLRTLPQMDRKALTPFLSSDLNTYIDQMSRDSTYADHPVVQTVSRMLQVQIRIIQAASADIQIGDGSGAILLLGYLPELEHYVSIEPTNEARYQVGDFVMVRLKAERGKRHADYVAEIKQVLPGNCYLVKYMSESGGKGMYVWPSVEETSTEPATNITKKLPVPTLDEKKSCSRLQYFRFSY